MINLVEKGKRLFFRLTDLTIKKRKCDMIVKEVIKMQFIEKMDIEKLKLWEKNPRFNDEAAERLAKVIEKHGFIDPIIIDSNYIVRAGNTRVKAAKLAGLKYIPAVMVDFENEEAAEAYSIADNKANEWAQWDYLGLKEIIDSIGDYDFEDIGFTKEEYDDLFNRKLFDEELRCELEQRLAADNEEFQENVETIGKLNDIWLLGRHRLMCGDSTMISDVQKLMNGQKARFVFTDPPWNVDYGSDTRHPSWKPRQILNDNMSTEEFGAFLLRAFNCMREISEAGCMTYVVMSAQEWGSLMNVMREVGYHWSSTIIWKKDSLVLSRKDYHTQYEPIWYGWLEGTRLCPLKDRKQSDVWEMPRPKVSEEHPTMKPVSLVAKAMLNSSHIGDLTLDLFGGSGTTMIAAQQTGRVCFMMELDPKYCDVIVKRYVSQFGTDSVFLLSGGEKIPYAETQIT